MAYNDPIYLSREGCSEATKAWATFGQLVVALILYVLILFLVRELYLAYKGKTWEELSADEKTSAGLYSVFWIITVPLTILVGAFYWLGKWILLPFTAAEKKDLREMETRINRKIILNGVNPTPVVPKTKFQIGQLVTGVRGNPDNYKHLNEGSVCKVLTIDEKGNMTLVLVDHKDFAKHKEQIGKVFKAPARNFVKYVKRR